MPTKSIPDEVLSEIILTAEPNAALDFSRKPLDDDLYAACQIIAKASNITLCSFDNSLHKKSIIGTLTEIAHRSNCRVRKVSLKDETWVQSDNGPLLTFSKETGKAVALLRGKKGQYQLLTPTQGQTDTTSENITEKVDDYAFMFYKNLPSEPIKLRSLMRFAFDGHLADIGLAISIQFILSLLALFIPISMGILFDEVIPNADFPLLLQFTIVLTVNVFITTFFGVSQIIAFLRLRLKVNFKLQSALWSRLIALPVSFFRRFGVGDLADRVGGIDYMQQQMTGMILGSITGGLVSFVTLGFMLYYSPILTLITLGLIVIVAIAFVITTIYRIKHLRKVYYHNGKLSSFVFRFLLAIKKLRLTHRESSVMFLWSKRFSKKIRHMRSAEKISIYSSLFSSVFGVLSTIIIFTAVSKLQDSLSFGGFITFNALFGQFFAAIFAMIAAFMEIYTIKPLYERIEPVLEATPESVICNHETIALHGNVELNHVSFRYAKENVFLFKDLNITAKKGDFIGIAGPSGAGKSTLLRLLLGFEKPESGLVLYDNYDLAQSHLPSIRRQLGVVLQDSIPTPGSILENIIGVDTSLTIDDAWEAAELVDFANDIRQMPMGMQTLVGEAGSTFSAGQRQRLFLARALIHKPRVLFLDEATSALDNKTQAIVHANLSKLNMTRIMVTHRLHTLKEADNIFVLDHGEIVEQGNFDTLRKQQGLFAEWIAPTP